MQHCQQTAWSTTPNIPSKVDFLIGLDAPGTRVREEVKRGKDGELFQSEQN